MSSTRKVISTEDAPSAIGPYSQAIQANGMLYVSGNIGLDAKTMEFVGEDVASQTKQAMINMGHILKAGNASFDSVVKVTILLRDMNDFAVVNEVYSTFFPINPPARATYAVSGLPKDARVEIDAIAVCDM